MTARLYVKRNDWDRFITSASKIAKEGGATALVDLAEDIKDGAVERAPISPDGTPGQGTLRAAIMIEKETYGILFDKTRVRVTIDEELAPYAIYMHEGMDADGGTPGYQPTAQRDSSHRGRDIGWKFLTRSFEFFYRDALARIRRGVNKGWSR